MNRRAVIWGGLAVLAGLHPHLHEKWRWVEEVMTDGVAWGARFRWLDLTDLVLHTGVLLLAVVMGVRALRRSRRR